MSYHPDPSSRTRPKLPKSTFTLLTMVYQRPSVADERSASYITKLISAKLSAIKTTLHGETEPLLEERFYTESRGRPDLFRKSIAEAKDRYYTTSCSGQKGLQDDLGRLWLARSSLKNSTFTHSVCLGVRTR